MSEKAKAVAMRDRLNKMAEEVMQGNPPDMEDHVVACCLAVAVEELEKWLYDDQWTPSVRPYIDDRDFEIPFPPGAEDDPAQGGPPWARKKVSVLERFPTLRRLKEQGKLNPTKVTEDALELLKRTPFEDWDVVLREEFRSGHRQELIRALRSKTGASIKKILELVDEIIATVPGWGIDTKPGDECPSPTCGSKNIKTAADSSNRRYECQDCGTLWGKVVW